MKINKLFFYTFLIIYLELIYKVTVYSNIFDINLVYTLLFSIPIIFILTLLSSLGSIKINQVLCFVFPWIWYL